MNVDAISWKILSVVQNDGRISLKTLAGKVGLSLPATSERLKRLEEAGILQGYCARVDHEAIGYGVMAVIGMTTAQPDKLRFIRRLQEMPEVLECLHVTGQDSYLIRVITTSLKHLEEFVGTINVFGETRTSIVMSHPIKQRAISSPDDLNLLN
ncbi:Lrp/AsnC family transcriptional regulator [Marinomonas algicola]|jgi:Lrp/AsnC family transcriptional regulator, leucine-responsive regulatory protein|uniref:Lrp/AsnC family transcriptional regulator n=1 Tax=Marinomonas algicola TaxID=2773454 RepID=UPI00174C35DA|nr:Lrp/AsnC family transcriptional regulator [Marinomonas algicola]